MTQTWPAPFTEKNGQLLEAVTQALNTAEDFESAVRAGASRAVPSFADLVVLVVRRERMDDWLEVVHADPGQEPGIKARLRPLLADLHRAAANELRQGRHFRWIPEVGDMTTRWLRKEPVLLQLLQTLKIRSLMVVPLRSGGSFLGGVAFARTSHRDQPYHAADLALAQIIARRIALAIQTVELHGLVLDDRSRQSRLEAALRKWIQVFDHAGWGAAIVDGQDHRIEAVNPAFARLHDFPGPDSLSGRHFSDVLSPDRVGELAWWTSSNEPLAYESLHRRANGTLLPVLTNVTPLVTSEGATSYVVTIQDLTELKRAEERLRAAQRLEAVGRLAGGVAHEVNNMMTIILGFSDLLGRNGVLPAERLREVEEIRKAATRAGKITQQLLAFSRQQILQPTTLPLNEVLTELWPMLRLMLPANIELETSFTSQEVTVQADRAQLEQVVINLAFNARDAMPGGGKLRLTTDSRWLDDNDGRRVIGIPFVPGVYALVSVADSGHGMDPATLAQVFDPFFTTKPAGSGTGLGLATVYGIVKQSGGYVWMESAPGAGTTVTVCLPQVQQLEQLAPASATTEEPTECRAGTVLIIEDEEGVRELAHRVLEQHGHRVLDARDGEHAVTLLGEFGAELDLVLSDAVVPGMGAAELETLVRELRPDLPILFMSGYSREEMVERGIIHPHSAFLQKPFTTAQLTDVVCRELEAMLEARRGGVVTS